MKAAKPKRRAYKPVFFGSPVDLPAFMSPQEKGRWDAVQRGLDEILHKPIERASFSEIFKRREQVAVVLSALSFEVVFDVENRRVKIHEALGDVEF